jgi:hypothetical protein
VSLGLRDAMARKLGSMAAVDAYPTIARTNHKD